MDSALQEVLLQITAIVLFAGLFTTVVVQAIKKANPTLTPVATVGSAFGTALVIVFLSLLAVDSTWTASLVATGILASILVGGASIGIYETGKAVATRL